MNRCARCNWRPEDDETLEEHAEAASHPLCSACEKSLPSDRPRVCRDCQDANGALLAEILDLWRELPDHLSEHAAERLPGGDALVLNGPGARGAQGSDDPELRKLIDDNRMSDTPSVAWTLVSWADDWRRVRDEEDRDRDSVSGHAALVLDAHAYLTDHAAWAAAEHWAWAEYAADIKHLHGALLWATGRHRQPTRLGVLCFACRGKLVYRIVREQDAEPAPARPRWWLAKDVFGPVDAGEYARRHLGTAGLEEENATCRDCGLTYTPAALLLAQRAAVEDAQWQVDDDGTRWATPRALAEWLPRPEPTLRKWQWEGVVRATRRYGMVYLHVDDAAAINTARPPRPKHVDAS